MARQGIAIVLSDSSDIDWTDRQVELLDAALALLVALGRAPTMTEVAREASCSKETLYKWFGGRDGLLAAMVRRQASKVRGLPLGAEGLDAAALVLRLEVFARDWLQVIHGQTSVALNRLAVGQAGHQRHGLGDIMLDNGPAAVRSRIKTLLEEGRSLGLLAFDSPDEAFGALFGLVVRDTQIRLLLGEKLNADDALVEHDARLAVRQFLTLYGTTKIRP
ncbi:TetR/AcrR family transcriptional regulator C-terminal domain-containing protein [Aureimonas altamirensis]|jgi:AcrR family transcriptional regulator|uniref:TetR/AcrR family transcriptional regulator C-terminal domain-containing protein n=1 Tax=Aureimonas altamirensis TaxID=370622 RepID=UPI001E442F2B|nr:TetR/AcrR family transcriptional regulator C-terminal domain-containing protein [Aureimonas altamirensis]UHD45069.1 TetR/AcrR family transcriptional regulator C-terminal domain-containing protein [Aureimonas altamirensis]